MVVEEEIYRRGGGISKKIVKFSERGRIVRSFPVFVGSLSDMIVTTPVNSL